MVKLLGKSDAYNFKVVKWQNSRMVGAYPL